MGVYSVNITNITYNTVSFRIDVTIDSSTSDTMPYKTIYQISGGGGTPQEEVAHGTLAPGDSDTKTLTENYSIPSNTTCTVRCYLNAYWEYDNNWHLGVGTSDSKISPPKPPESVTSSVSSNGNTLTIVWYQDLGGNATSISNRVEILGTNLSTSSITIAGTTNNYSARSCSLNVSSLSSGTYTARIYSDNGSSDYTDKVFIIEKQQQEGNGSWSNVSLTQAANSTAINYTATWTSTWASNISWQLSAYLDTDNNSSTRLKIQTGTLSNGESLTISGTTSNVSAGNHTIYFHADANGPDGDITSRTIQVSEEGGTPSFDVRELRLWKWGYYQGEYDYNWEYSDASDRQLKDAEDAVRNL